LQPLEELQENMRVRMEVAGILRKYRLANIHNKHDAEEHASKQNYEVCACSILLLSLFIFFDI
jgi:breast cancer metastasis-suppressor 1-like protein